MARRPCDNSAGITVKPSSACMASTRHGTTSIVEKVTVTGQRGAIHQGRQERDQMDEAGCGRDAVPLAGKRRYDFPNLGVIWEMSDYAPGAQIRDKPVAG